MEVRKRNFTPTRLELKGWETVTCWGVSATDLGEVGSLVASLKAHMPMESQDRFDWEVIQQEQEDFELKTVYVWSGAGVGDRKRSYAVLQKELADRPVGRSHVVRVIVEVAPRDLAWHDG